jgi:hypothetical protein
LVTLSRHQRSGVTAARLRTRQFSLMWVADAKQDSVRDDHERYRWERARHAGRQGRQGRQAITALGAVTGRA